MTTRTNFASYFSDFGGRAWLNTAHQGALPLCAATAAEQAIGWKVCPSKLTQERFDEVPSQLRRSLSRLLGATVDEVVLANSASYGLHLVANAFPWKPGDEILVMGSDFPSDILPWLTLEERFGVTVRRIRPRRHVVEPDELTAEISQKTRLFCTTWVHSFSGFAIDVEALGEICKAHDVMFVLNGSQAVGARPVDVKALPVDALTGVGFKWLCGPYGTGYCWLSPNLMDRLVRTQAYWLSMLTAEDLASNVGELTVGPISSARDFDVFGTANFFNFTAFASAIDLLLEVGIAEVEAHDQFLVQTLVDALRRTEFRLISPLECGPRRSTLVLFDHSDPGALEQLSARVAGKSFDISRRLGAIRVSPHLYNCTEQIEDFADVLLS